MVDELLKMIAECHLQKPQTTSKMTIIIIVFINIPVKCPDLFFRKGLAVHVFNEATKLNAEVSILNGGYCPVTSCKNATFTGCPKTPEPA